MLQSTVQIFWKIHQRVSELIDSEKRYFPLTSFFAIYGVAHKGLIQHGVHLLHDDTINFQKLDAQTNHMIPISIGCTSGGGRSKFHVRCR